MGTRRGTRVPLARHAARIGLTLLPVLLALLHATGAVHLPLLERLDGFLYDARLRADMPGTQDPRIVIVDIDDNSLRRFGQWPWRRDLLARLTTELADRQHAAALGFDVMFTEAASDAVAAEAVRRLGLDPAVRDSPGLAAQVDRLALGLDSDRALAQALQGRPVVLGYYFTRSAQPRASGSLPTPLVPLAALPRAPGDRIRWNGFGASIQPLARSARGAGFLNQLVDADADGILRAAPLLALYEGPAGEPGYYESLALAVLRVAQDSRTVRAVPAAGTHGGGDADGPLLQAIEWTGATGDRLRVPLDTRGAVLVPYRGLGGPAGGSFRYVSATQVLDGHLAPGELAGRIVLVGATAPGLQDLRSTPLGSAYPGVEVHANIVSGLLDGRTPSVPDYATGYEVTVLVLAGLLLAVGMSALPALPAGGLALLTAMGVVALNLGLYRWAGLVLPLAASLTMVAAAFAVNMSWGYGVEARTRRSLARLFGSYVPAPLVREMVADPARYSMRARSKELTVMFCDLRGFTALAEHMSPEETQALLNTLFSQLTGIVSAHRGTVDKYMGDCVMAFWGAPLDVPDHAACAVAAALEMAAAVRTLSDSRLARGQSALAAGIGLNTGVMSVGDMGSQVRRSYTVVGDAVNLAARLEGLCSPYGVDIVAAESTMKLAPAFEWCELDRVRVRGRARPVAIHAPLARAGALEPRRQAELQRWREALAAYQARDWAGCHAALERLKQADAKNILYRLYAERVASYKLAPPPPEWDGATRFDSK